MNPFRSARNAKIRTFEGCVGSSLLYGPVVISDPLLGCPLTVAAGRVRAARDGDESTYFVSGWGTTAEQALQGCLYEADETYFAQIIPERRILRSCANAIYGRVVEPPGILLFSEEQYDRREGGNRQPALRNMVPTRWDRSAPEDWILSDDKLGTEQAWVPARLCFLGYDPCEGSSLPAADSNGLALGISVEGAAMSALLELIERDATSIWWYNRLVLPRIDPKSMASDTVSSYEDWLRHRGRELRLLRLTLDLAVPTVAAISSDSSGRFPAMGFAAGASWSEAAIRAVGELAQCEANLALLSQQARQQGTIRFTPGARQLYRWHQETDLGLCPFLQGGNSGPACTDESTLDYASCVKLCQERNLEIFAVILMQDEQRSLVRIFAPGLRSTKPRFGPGRLYSVPGTLGLRPASSNLICRDPFPF
ncbi:YcaO-like family protein [Mesorhizobium sp. B4-1-4]|uniref:YcaO-like family protein n=1 Tax=Mesorhizobium sp. B4-1-4 TaxID=2589888 RepID=UPI00112E97C8|nr:YcaO-like family protein [Mesorhizobium sp. B4-1-4]UCI34563.1 YcaO-like family protein [Mesorhizobium sp. B4-1-4]